MITETKELKRIYSDRAKKRQLSTLKQNTVSASLPERYEKGQGDTRVQLSEAVEVPQKKLETIMEVGTLAETGKTKEVRLQEAKGIFFYVFTPWQKGEFKTATATV